MRSTVDSWPPPGAEKPTVHPKAPVAGKQLRPHHDGCFGCGSAAADGLLLSLEMGENNVVHASFEPRRAHQGAPGLTHGGLLVAAFDEALGYAVGVLLRKPCVTGRLETDFRRPVPVEQPLHIEAWLDGVSGRKVYASGLGRVGAADGPVAVEARAVFVEVAVEHFTTNGDADAVETVTRRGRS